MPTTFNDGLMPGESLQDLLDAYKNNPTFNGGNSTQFSDPSDVGPPAPSPSLFQAVSGAIQQHPEVMANGTDDDDELTQGPPQVSTIDDLRGKLAKLNGNKATLAPIGNVQSALQTLLAGGNSDLQDAIAQRNSAQQGANFLKAGNQIGAAFAHNTANNELANNLEQQASQPVSDVQLKNAQTLDKLKQAQLTDSVQDQLKQSDPNSAISQAAREFYQKTTGREANPGMAAIDLQKLDPILGRMFTAEENAKSRALQYSQLRDNKRQGMDQKEFESLNKSKDYQDALAQSRNADAAAGQIADAYTNPVSNASLPIKLARMMVSGRINEQELAAFGGSQAVTNRLQQLGSQMSNGKKLTPQDLQFMNQMVSNIKSEANNNIQSSVMNHAKSYSVRSNQSVGDAYRVLTGDDMPSQAALPQSQGPAIGPHGPSVFQNGHQFNWNPVTKAYE